MSTFITSAQDSGAQHAFDRADISIVLYDSLASGVKPIGIAKSFSSMSQSLRLQSMYCLKCRQQDSQENQRTKHSQMTELAAFERMEHIAQFTGSSTPFVIDLVHARRQIKMVSLLRDH